MGLEDEKLVMSGEDASLCMRYFMDLMYTKGWLVVASFAYNGKEIASCSVLTLEETAELVEDLKKNKDVRHVEEKKETVQ